MRIEFLLRVQSYVRYVRIVHRIVRHSEIIFEIPVVFPILNIKLFSKYINGEVFKLLVCD